MINFASKVSKKLLRWYDAERRQLPWRTPPHEMAEPYHVWLSEIMLQQTTVVTVVPYYVNFLARWPTLHELARADLDEVLHAWQGLGYYSRARNLHKCAQVVVRYHNGRFPGTEKALIKLPGIGPYTAAAIMAIAFGHKATPIDGNIERVVARLHAFAAPLPTARRKLKALAEALTPDRRAGDFAQALMDLGATVCKPRVAACEACPLIENCQAAAADPLKFPVKLPKKARPVRYGVVFWVERPDGTVLLRRRPETGLLGGMMEFPSTPWRETPWNDERLPETVPVAADWQLLEDRVVHTFSHFRLELKIVAACIDTAGGGDVVWCLPEDFATQALPTVMKKVAATVAAKAAKPSFDY